VTIMRDISKKITDIDACGQRPPISPCLNCVYHGNEMSDNWCAWFGCKEESVTYCMYWKERK